MRLWSIHPKYLDLIGLIALWRESLLAKKVLLGETKGYINHPQLERFRSCSNPLSAINTYLMFIYQEALSRGYRFDKSKFEENQLSLKIKVSTGQANYEFNHLLNKLKLRDKEKYYSLKDRTNISLHLLFMPVPGGVESWEKTL